MSTNPLMTILLNNTNILKMGTYGGSYTIGDTTLTFPGSQLHYASKYSEVEDIIYSTESNGIAINWHNIDNNDALINPIFEVYHQTSIGSPTKDVYLELRNAVTKIRYEGSDYQENINKSIILNTQVSERALPNSERKTRISGISLNVGMIAALSVIISSMPDMEKIFEEKENHVNALSFMMGMKESAYWFTNFITPIIINFVSYLIQAAIYSYVFGLTGSNFGLVLIVFWLFVLSEICFQFFFSTFMNKGTSGRSLTVILIVLALVMGLLHQFLTLDSSSHNDGLTHFLCIFPIGAFELFMMQGYIACATNMPSFQWNNMQDRVFLGQPWICMLWLGIDTVFYFVLFVIFNAVMPRPFGNPPLKFSELFTKNGCRKLFGKKKKSLQVSGTTDVILGLEDVTKKYKKKQKQLMMFHLK